MYGILNAERAFLACHGRPYRGWRKITTLYMAEGKKKQYRGIVIER